MGGKVSVLEARPEYLGRVETIHPVDTPVEQAVAEMVRLSYQILKYREAISEIAVQRRELASLLLDALGPTAAAKRLGISRQTLW